jgi:hypothetical protein
MAELDRERAAIRAILSEFTGRRYSFGDIVNETVFDVENDRYLVVSQGWEPYRRVHGVLIHLDIIDGKIWVQRDGTEDGIANRLVEAGIPKSRIVLAFHPPDVRPHTEFAVA